MAYITVLKDSTPSKIHKLKENKTERLTIGKLNPSGFSCMKTLLKETTVLPRFSPRITSIYRLVSSFSKYWHLNL